MYPVPGLPKGEIVSRPIPLGFIPAYSYQYNISSVQTSYGYNVNITTPVNPSTAVTKEDSTQLGITVPLSSLLNLKKLLYNYGITDLYQLSSQFVNGVQVNKYIIQPGTSLIEDIYAKVKSSGIVYDIQKMVNEPTVKSADTYHPLPVASYL